MADNQALADPSPTPPSLNRTLFSGCSNSVTYRSPCRLKTYVHSVISPALPNFKASRGWCVRFMKQHDFVLRTRTTLSQRLPADLETKIENFNKFLHDCRLNDDFDDEMIINMDETPVYFDVVPTKTVDQKGVKSVKVRTTGSEKRHITGALACTAAGDMLPPMIIF